VAQKAAQKIEFACEKMLETALRARFLRWHSFRGSGFADRCVTTPPRGPMLKCLILLASSNHPSRLNRPNRTKSRTKVPVKVPGQKPDVPAAFTASILLPLE
jgi:hypothetical protein